jgi:hypothetical protein
MISNKDDLLFWKSYLLIISDLFTDMPVEEDFKILRRFITMFLTIVETDYELTINTYEWNTMIQSCLERLGISKSMQKFDVENTFNSYAKKKKLSKTSPLDGKYIIEIINSIN